jgi:hypothetical protein
MVGIGLVGIWDFRAIVAGIADPITIRIFLIGIRHLGAVILVIAYPVVVGVNTGGLRDYDEAIFTVLMVVVAPLVTENLVNRMIGGVHGHILEMHAIVLDVENAGVSADRAFVDGDRRAGSVNHQAIGIHEREGALEIDVEGFAR